MCVFTVLLYVALRTYGAITAFLISRIYRFQLHEGLGFVYTKTTEAKKERRTHFECFLLQWIKMQDYVFNRMVRCFCCFLFLNSIALVFSFFYLFSSEILSNSSIHRRTSSMSWNMSLCFVKTVKWMHSFTVSCRLQLAVHFSLFIFFNLCSDCSGSTLDILLPL